jgi:hypothetical protein
MGPVKAAVDLGCIEHARIALKVRALAGHLSRNLAGDGPARRADPKRRQDAAGFYSFHIW